VAYLHQALPRPSQVAVAGYSFGAAMAAAVAASGGPLAGLALIAPPVTAPIWETPNRLSIDGPLLVVAGSQDAYCPREALANLATAVPAATITVIDGADHFFFVGLRALEAAIAAWAGKLTR
jgi:alpha/beta superfamily hydrolase